MTARRESTLAWTINWSGTAVMWLLGWSVLFTLCLSVRPVWALATQALWLAAFLSVPLALRGHWRRRYSAVLGLRPLGRGLPWAVAGAMAFMLGVFSLILLYTHLTPEPGPVKLFYRYSELPLGTAVLLVTVAVQVPLTEEFALRGILQGQVARRAGWLVAGTLGAAVFALMHFSRTYVPHYFVGGLVLAYARSTTRSVWTPVLLHGLMNAVLFCAAELNIPGPAASHVLRALPVPLISASLAASFATALLLLHVAGRARRHADPAAIAFRAAAPVVPT